MFKNVKAFSSFSVDDLKVAKRFYAETLDLNVDETPEGLVLHIAGGSDVFIYPKADHAAATFTILNFPVSDADHAVDALTAKGVRFEVYLEGDMKTDAKGIARGEGKGDGPTIAWFKDPAGNFVSVLATKGS